jgi:hypothetical protein
MPHDGLSLVLLASATYASNLSGDESAGAHFTFGGAFFDSDGEVKYLSYHSMSA